jgi:hypothetical protein
MTASGANGAGAIPALVQDVAAQIIGDVLLARQVSGTLRIRSAQLRADSVKLRTPREVHSPITTATLSRADRRRRSERIERRAERAAWLSL